MYQTTMTLAHLEVIATLEALDVSPDYSGRGMYGVTCFGLVTDDPLSAVIRMTRTLMEAFDIDDDLADETADLLDALSHGARIDNMGQQSIVYWPHITVDRDGRD